MLIIGFFFFQAEDGIRDLVRSRGLGDVYKRQEQLIQSAIEKLLVGRTAIVIAHRLSTIQNADKIIVLHKGEIREIGNHQELLSKKGIYYKLYQFCLLYTSDAADERSSVDLGGRRIIKKKKHENKEESVMYKENKRTTHYIELSKYTTHINNTTQY